ncbi:hypothetical protein BDN72DRAFT_844459, partial [Pluteus cervinus]
MTERDKLHDESMELDSINNVSSENSSDPTDKFWTFYLNQTSKADRDMVEDWKGTTDGILIFAGLFSAVITSFIIESYQSLQPAIDELTLRAIAQISLQLAAVNGTGDGSVAPYVLPDLNDYKPTKTATWVNIFWFTSLFFSLTCALTATLVQQWSREYIQSIERYQVPRQRGQVRAHLFQGLTQYKMSGFMDAIPALLHISVFTFFAGLFMLIHPINTTVGIVLFCLFLFGSALYFFTSLIALYYHSYPFSTPLSQWFLRIAKIWRLKKHTGKLSRLREAAAQSNDSALLEAYSYVLTAANEDREFEELLDVLPDFYAAQRSPTNLVNLLGEFYRNQGFRIRELLEDTKALQGRARDKKVLIFLNFMYTTTRLTVNPAASRVITDILTDWASLAFTDFLDDPNPYISNLAFAVAAHATSCTKDRMLIKQISTESDLTMSQVVDILQPIRDYQLPSLIEDGRKKVQSTRPFGYITSCFERYPRLRTLCPQVYSVLIHAGQTNLEVAYVQVAEIFLLEIYRAQLTSGMRDVVDMIYMFLCSLDKAALTDSMDLLRKFKDAHPHDRRITAAIARCEFRVDMLAQQPRRDANITADSTSSTLSPPRDEIHGGYSTASGFGSNTNNRPIQGRYKYHLSDEPVLTVMSPTTFSPPSSAGIFGQLQDPHSPSPRMGHSQHPPSQHTSPTPPLRLHLPPGASSPNHPGSHAALPPGASPARRGGSPWDAGASPLLPLAGGSSASPNQPQYVTAPGTDASLVAGLIDNDPIRRPSVSYGVGYRRGRDDDDSDNEHDYRGSRPAPSGRSSTPRPAPHRRDRTDYDEVSRVD